MVKGEGATAGLTEYPSTLQRWMVSGQETTRVVNEFEKKKSKQRTNHPMQRIMRRLQVFSWHLPKM